MKRYILLFSIFIMFIPIFVNAETCDTDKVAISSITIENKSESVEELDEATANGKSINLNLSMSKIGDNITYKIVIKNDSNEDYELGKNSFNINSDYIGYTLEAENNNYIVNANSSKVVYLKVNYANEIPVEAFESGTYNDNKSMILNLSTGDTINVSDTLKNQNPGDTLVRFILIIIICAGIGLIILKSTKSIKFMLLIVGVILIIPMSVYALCKCEIKIESKVIIRENEYDIFTLDYTNIGDDLSNEIKYYRNFADVTKMPSLFHHIYNNKITTASIVIPYGEDYILLKGGGATYNANLNKYENDSKFYNENKNVINKTFENNSNVRCYEEDDKYYCIDCSRNVYQECRLTHFRGEAYKNGSVSYRIYNYFCKIESNGTSYCSEIYE